MKGSQQALRTKPAAKAPTWTVVQEPCAQEVLALCRMGTPYCAQSLETAKLRLGSECFLGPSKGTQQLPQHPRELRDEGGGRLEVIGQPGQPSGHEEEW